MYNFVGAYDSPGKYQELLSPEIDIDTDEDIDNNDNYVKFMWKI